MAWDGKTHSACVLFLSLANRSKTSQSCREQTGNSFSFLINAGWGTDWTPIQTGSWEERQEGIIWHQTKFLTHNTANVSWPERVTFPGMLRLSAPITHGWKRTQPRWKPCKTRRFVSSLCTHFVPRVTRGQSRGDARVAAFQKYFNWGLKQFCPPSPVSLHHA